MNHHLEMIATFKQTCDSFFSKNGYARRSSEPIVPEADKSILYTNSAIIPFKSMIAENRIPQIPQYLFQECIRLHETKLTPNEQYFLQRMSCFSMLGVFAPIHLLVQSCQDMVTFLLDVLQVDKDRLVFHAASEDEAFWCSLKNVGVPILWDKTPADDYQWQYGMPDVIGRGLNIGILPKGVRPETITLVDEVDIGQIIVIKNKGYPTCFEIALGVEAFLWRNGGKESPFAVSEIAAFMPFKFEPLHIQLMDALVLSIVFYGNNVDLFTGNSLRFVKGKNRLSAVKKAVKNIAEIEALVRPNFDVTKVIVEYANYRAFREERVARLLQTIALEGSNYIQREEKLFEYTAACARLVKEKNLSYAEACHRLRDKGQRKYTLSPSVMESALNKMRDLIGE